MAKNKRSIPLFLFISFIILFSKNAVSQDSIFFVNGNIMSAKVSEINNSEIKYTSYNNSTDGPLYITLKSKVRFIKYADNYTDSFSVSIQPIELSKLELRHNEVYYCRKKIGDADLLALIKEVEDPALKQKMINEFDLMKKYKQKHFVHMIVGTGLFAGCLLSAALYGVALQIPVLGIFYTAIGLAVFIPTTIISVKNKHRYFNQQKILVNDYNQLK